MVNTGISLIMDDLGGGIIAFILSTVLTVTFGEIIPQAICTRYGLQVGAALCWLVRIFMVLLFILAYPVGKLLDCILGVEIGNTYTRAQFKKLIELHTASAIRERYGDEEGIGQSDLVLIVNSFDFSTKCAQDIMTPIAKVFMLDSAQKLSPRVLNETVASGHNRIPVFEDSSDSILGFIQARDLLLLDPAQSLPIAQIFSAFGTPIVTVRADEKLPAVMQEMKSGHTSMAIVYRVNTEGEGDPFYENVGLITREDIVSEIVGDEFADIGQTTHPSEEALLAHEDALQNTDAGATIYSTPSQSYTPSQTLTETEPTETTEQPVQPTQTVTDSSGILAADQSAESDRNTPTERHRDTEMEILSPSPSTDNSTTDTNTNFNTNNTTIITVTTRPVSPPTPPAPQPSLSMQGALPYSPLFARGVSQKQLRTRVWTSCGLFVRERLSSVVAFLQLNFPYFAAWPTRNIENLLRSSDAYEISPYKASTISKTHGHGHAHKNTHAPLTALFTPPDSNSNNTSTGTDDGEMDKQTRAEWAMKAPAVCKACLQAQAHPELILVLSGNLVVCILFFFNHLKLFISLLYFSLTFCSSIIILHILSLLPLPPVSFLIACSPSF